MSRQEKFNALRDHAMNGRLFKKLSQTEIALCEEFIRESEHLDRDAFAEKVNRWYLHEQKPKNATTMWALVLQSI